MTGVFHGAADEQVLIASAPYDNLGAAIHGQNLRGLGLFESCQVDFVIAEKIVRE
jgi:hypothetical protein